MDDIFRGRRTGDFGMGSLFSDETLGVTDGKTPGRINLLSVSLNRAAVLTV
jgi:hypothetical protein